MINMTIVSAVRIAAINRAVQGTAINSLLSDERSYEAQSASTFDVLRKFSLVLRANARNMTRNNFSSFSYETVDDLHVLVVED